MILMLTVNQILSLILFYANVCEDIDDKDRSDY